MSDVFTIHEAAAALYAADENGDATGDALYLGECMESIRIEEDYDEVRLTLLDDLWRSRDLLSPTGAKES